MKFAAGLIALASAKETYNGDQVYRFEDISIGTMTKLKLASRLYNFDMWTPSSIEEIRPGTTVDIHVSAKESHDFEYDLVTDEINFELISMDLQADIDAQNPDFVSGRHDYEQYNDFDTIQQFLKDTADANDDVVYKEFGESGEGRPIIALEVGSGSKVVSIDCGIHAREWISPAYCQWFIREVTTGQFASYKNDIKFLIQPLLNPDGYAYSWTGSRMWRKNRVNNQGSNCIGVDLNRNYDAKWSGAGASGNACAENYYGPSMCSENECKAQVAYLEPYMADGSLKAFLTFHSYGQYILYPYSYDYLSRPDNYDELYALGEDMVSAIAAVYGKSYTMGQGKDVLYPAAGGSDDWAYDKMKAMGNDAPLSYTYELRDQGRYGFVLPANQIKPNCEEIDPSMKVLLDYVIENK